MVLRNCLYGVVATKESQTDLASKAPNHEASAKVDVDSREPQAILIVKTPDLEVYSKDLLDPKFVEATNNKATMFKVAETKTTLQVIFAPF